MSRPDTFDDLIEQGMERLRELRRQRDKLSKEEAARKQPDFERNVRQIMEETQQEVHRDDLERLDTNVAGVVIDGKRYRRKGLSKKTYLTLAGPVEVERTVYVERGGSGGKTIALLDLSVGMVAESWTPLAAEVACHYLEAVTPRKTAALLAQHGGMQPSPSHLDRLPKVFNKLWESKRVELEEAVREEDEWPAADRIAAICFSLDGVMLGMKGAPRTAEPEGPKGHREASCAAVFLIDAQGERHKTVRQARAPEAKKVTLHEWLEAELKAARERYPTALLLGVADGADENWRIVNELALAVGAKVIRTLDFYHLMEHLANALKALFGARSKKIAQQLQAWSKELQERPHGARRVIRELESLLDEAPSQFAREVMEKELAYVKRHHKKKMLRYAWLRKHNLPIGSGIIESTCKSTIGERLKLSGMTWTHAGAQGVATLRALEQSGRLRPAWRATRERLLCRPFLVDPDTSRKRPTIHAC